MNEADHNQQPIGDWTPWQAEHVARFWDYWSAHSPEDFYFGESNKIALTRLADWLQLLPARVVDYGCGRGPLVGPLTEKGCQISGIEFSDSSIAVVNDKWRSHPGWEGAHHVKDLAAAGEFDVAYCVEVIEHLTGEFLEMTWANLKALLKPGGIAIITTPNDECLDDSKVYCPFCKSTFHRWQHVRKWDAASLRAALETAGFEVDICTGTNFGSFMADELPPLKACTYYNLRDCLGLRVLRMIDRWRSGKTREATCPLAERSLLLKKLSLPRGPHLIAVARKVG